MVTTKVINNSDSSVEIKEGNAGVYCRIGEVLAHNSLTLTVNQHATYREYWCATQPNDGEKVILTSDDCVECEEVEIYMASGRLAWKKLKLRKKQGQHADANIIRFFTWIGGLFKKAS